MTRVIYFQLPAPFDGVAVHPWTESGGLRARSRAFPGRSRPLETFVHQPTVRVCRVVSSAILAGMVLAMAIPLAGQARQRALYVSVLNKQGAPVKDVGPEDFVVREDGVAREVLRVEPATDPMQVSLLVDNSQAAREAIQHMRDGLGSFVSRLTAAGHSVAFITLGDRPTIQVDLTSDGAALKSKGVDRLFAQPGAGAYLLEGLIETTRGIMKNESARPVIVALITEGVEFSNQSYEQVLEALKKSSASFHALLVTDGNKPDLTSDEARNRNVVLDRGTRETGGRRETLISNMAIPSALDKLAGELLAQHKVTYASPDRLVPADKITVAASNKNLVARGVPIKVPSTR